MSRPREAAGRHIADLPLSGAPIAVRISAVTVGAIIPALLESCRALTPT
jgi:hypothetical protein